MADEGDGDEQQFFAKPRSTSQIREPIAPPSLTKKIAVGVAIAAGAVAAYFFLKPERTGVLWIVNPGPGRVEIQVDKQTHALDEGNLLDVKVPVSPEVEVVARRSRGEDRHTVDVAPLADGVTILDLAGDASYVVADVSSKYKDSPENKLDILDVSPPAEVHHIAYPGSSLVRPGHPLPNKDSWELQVVPRGPDGLQVFKVFRVLPSRLDDKDKLTTLLTAAMSATIASDYENMVTILGTSTTSRNVLIPRSKNAP